MKLNLSVNRNHIACAALVAAVLSFSPGGLSAREDTVRVTLAQMLDHAGKQSPMVLAARSEAAMAEGGALASLAGFLPQITVSEVFTRSNDPVFAFGTKLRQSIFSQQDFSIPSLNEPSAITNYATRAVLQQPLFNGGQSRYGRRTALAYLDAANEAAVFTAQEAAFQVKQSYYSLILARESLVVIDAALEAARGHRHQASRMAETGMATRADELKASVRVAELEQERIRARNTVTVAAEYLKLASGWTGEAPLSPADTLARSDFEAGIETLTAHAMSGHARLAAAEHVARAAEYASRSALGEYIPHLNAFAQFERNSDKAFGGDGDNWMVGVSLDWKIFNGLSTAGKVKTARAVREKANHEAALMRHKVSVEVRQAWLDSRAAAERIEVADSAREQADESLRIVQNQYREGLATITDLLDTELAATNARLGYTGALYEYNLALARLSLASGGYPTND